MKTNLGENTEIFKRFLIYLLCKQFLLSFIAVGCAISKFWRFLSCNLIYFKQKFDDKWTQSRDKLDVSDMIVTLPHFTFETYYIYHLKAVSLPCDMYVPVFFNIFHILPGYFCLNRWVK